MMEKYNLQPVGKVEDWIGPKKESLKKVLSGDELTRLAEVEREIKELEEEIKGLPEVQRLKGLKQLGEIDQDIPQTRYQHCELCAEQLKFAGIKLGLSTEEIKILISSAWMHDIGHPVLSHTSDVVLEQLGYGNHEERAVTTIQNEDGSIGKLLTKHGVDASKVVAAVREKGYLGELQSIFDTLSYLTIDSAAAGEPMYADHGAGLISDLRGVDRARDAVIVKTPSLWQELLENRAKMMHDVYLHPNKRKQRAALRAFIMIAVKKGFLSYETLMRETDSEIEAHLQSLVEIDEAAGNRIVREGIYPSLNKYINIWGMRLGIDDGDDWVREMHPDKGDMSESIINQISKEKIMDVLEQTVIIPPFDYTKETITILPEGMDQSVTLQARNIKLREEDKQYIIYIPQFVYT